MNTKAFNPFEMAQKQLDEEVPHALACEIEEFRETSAPVYIRAVLHVERDSQKRIVIGKKGEQLKEIGRQARIDMEKLFDGKVLVTGTKSGCMRRRV